MGDAAHLGWTEGYHTLEAEQTFVAALNPVATPSAVMRREYHGANDRVQPWGVTASGGDGNAHRSLSTSQPLNSLHHFARRGVTARCLLGEDQLAINHDFEQAAGGLHQTHLDLGERLLQFSRQTGSSGLVISNNAVLDGHMHCSDSLC
jgi:hypothetical protein